MTSSTCLMCPSISAMSVSQPLALRGDLGGLRVPHPPRAAGRARPAGIGMGANWASKSDLMRLGLGPDVGHSWPLQPLDLPAIQAGCFGILIDLIQDQVPYRQLDGERQRLILRHGRRREHQQAECQSGDESSEEAKDHCAFRILSRSLKESLAQSLVGRTLVLPALTGSVHWFQGRRSVRGMRFRPEDDALRRPQRDREIVDEELSAASRPRYAMGIGSRDSSP